MTRPISRKLLQAICVKSKKCLPLPETTNERLSPFGVAFLAMIFTLGLSPAAKSQMLAPAAPVSQEAFFTQSLAPESANSIWQSFRYSVASWRAESAHCSTPLPNAAADVRASQGFFATALQCTNSLRLRARTFDGSSAPSDKAKTTDPLASDSPDAPFSNATIARPAAQFSQGGSVEWGHLLWDSTKFLLVLHAWRLMTEPDTRAGLSGPFFQNYANAVSNIHGWNDGDPFNVNYIDHPMEGGVAGFLWIAHDPKYRQAEFGRSDYYWKSRLRAMAYAAAFSLQFEIGPVSEASIGAIQRENQKTGIVDWVITPSMGFVWMVGEDAVDQYIIKKFEVRTNSHVQRLILRSALNPTRSMSNLMQGKVPWHRLTRPGVREMDDPNFAAH